MLKKVGHLDCGHLGTRLALLTCGEKEEGGREGERSEERMEIGRRDNLRYGDEYGKMGEHQSKHGQL